MENYNHTDQYIHQISQVLPKLGRTFVPKRPDDSHTNLYFEPLYKRMVGRWIKTTKGTVMPAISLNNMSFQLLNAKIEVIDDCLIENRNYNELEILVEDSLKTIHLADHSFRDPLHFDIPDYPFKLKPLPALKSENLDEWIYFRDLANHVLNDVGNYLGLNIEVRIWRHHFDTGIYFQWKDDLGIGAGMSMEDPIAGSPYFYISGYVGSQQVDYSDALPLTKGKWIKEGQWKGGILPINELTRNNALIVVQTFFAESLKFLLA
jgi:hypothetical protein